MESSAQLPGRPSVLIIEDEVLVSENDQRDGSRTRLRNSGVAFDVQSAHEALRGNGYDLVLLDILLKEKRGSELADILKRNKTPNAFGTGFDKIDPPYDKVPLLVKPFLPEQLGLVAEPLTVSLGIPDL